MLKIVIADGSLPEVANVDQAVASRQGPGGATALRSAAVLAAGLGQHVPADPKEARDLAEILAFVERHADPFDRRIAEGHLTGSAIVMSASGDRVLMLHHRKLRRWLQPGGHAEPGEHEGEAVALREAREETGIEELSLHPSAPRPLDVDVHPIPARGVEPAHQHLDLRYLVVAPDGAALSRRPSEARALRWFTWTELERLDLDPGLRRALRAARAHTSRARPLTTPPEEAPDP